MIFRFIVFLVLIIITTSFSFSRNILDIKLFGGVVIPESNFGEFTQNKNIDYFENDTILKHGTLNYVNSNIGYNIGITGIANMTDEFKFIGTIEFQRINTYDNQVFKQNSSTEFHPLNVFTTQIPISPGIMYYILDSDIGAYIKGEISYNLISYSMNYPIDSVQFVLPNSVSENRLGYSIGFGADYFLDKVLISLEYRLKNSNLIGKNENESTKKAHLISIGFKF